MRFAFDSNILIYLAKGERSEADRRKVAHTRSLVLQLVDVATLVAPVQSMGEALRVLIKKFDRSEQEISGAIALWEANFEVVPTTLATLSDAVQLASRHHLQHWDSVILSAAAGSSCNVLLSEDVQDGFVWRGLTVINPFADTVHPLLASLLEP